MWYLSLGSASELTPCSSPQGGECCTKLIQAAYRCYSQGPLLSACSRLSNWWSRGILQHIRLALTFDEAEARHPEVPADLFPIKSPVVKIIMEDWGLFRMRKRWLHNIQLLCFHLFNIIDCRILWNIFSGS